MTRALQNVAWLSLCAFTLAAPLARAQQEPPPQQPNQQEPANQPSAPIPAYRSPLATAADNGDDADSDSQQLAPDTRALTGAQNLSLGGPTARSYWQPHFDVFGTADSNALETAKSPGWGAWTSVSGGIDVHESSGHNDATLSYTSGGVFSNYTGASNGVVQGLSLVDKIALRRASLSFLDSLTYLPESALGFGGLGGVALPPGGPTGLGPGLTAGQSILTGRGHTVENAAAAELDTFLTARSSLTFLGGYSLLRTFDNDLLDFNEFSARGGYNLQMTRYDTIGFSYTYSGIRYDNFNQFIDEHTFQASYGRRITGRLAFLLAAGPQVAISRIPIFGNTGSVSGSPTNPTEASWSLNAALQWQANRNGVGLVYYHGVTGGSGVLAGGITDNVNGSVTRRVSRTFSDSLTAGYARNHGIQISSSTASNHTYDYWFAGASVTHPLERTLGLTFSYQMQYQTSNSTFCIGPTCGTSLIRHMISVGVGWHERPRLF